MSWNQRYQSETSAMLDELNLRLRELDGRRMSTYHPSPPANMQTPPSYTQISPNAHPVQQVSPQQQSQYPPNPVGPAGFGMAQLLGGAAYPQQQPQFQQPTYNFSQPPVAVNHGMPLMPHSGNSHRPSAQFANWGGYGGQGGQPSMLDEDNAVPPDSNPWNIDAK